jgi:hypothetical protein
VLTRSLKTPTHEVLVVIVNFCGSVAVEQKRKPGGSPPKPNNKNRK